MKFLVLCIVQSAFGATMGTLSNSPLTKQELRRIGSVTPEGRIYSGDVIFYADILIKSGIVANRWPSGKLYFELDPSVEDWQKTAFLKACQAWATSTPVSCVERNGEASYVRLANHSGEHCGGPNVSCSALGMVGNRQQDLFIYSGHWNIQSVIQHELGHAFGLIHEQQRPDRDAYVTIIDGNIKGGAESQFSQISVATATEYDFESIMHYNNCAFSIKACNSNSPTEETSTIFPKACNRDRVGGTSITSLDIDGLRAAYLPQIFGLFKRSRRSACGVHNLSSQQTALICGSIDCNQASPITYNKKEDFHHELCTGGFTTDPPNFRVCPPMKDLISSSHNSASLACGFGSVETKYYWDWSCGCAKQSLEKLCIDIDAFDDTFLEKLRHSSDSRDIAALHYLDQISGWGKLGFVEKSTVDAVGKLLIRNYLQDSFNEKLYSMLCKMRIMIELNLYVKKDYLLKHINFLKFARAEGIDL